MTWTASAFGYAALGGGADRPCDRRTSARQRTDRRRFRNTRERRPRGNPGLWRWAFLAGLVAAPFVAPYLGIAPVVPTHQAGLLGLAIAGLLVGIGTQIGSGCTSGHGVSGLSNLSLRSLVATLTFMVVAGLTVYVVRHTELTEALSRLPRFVR